MLVILWVMISWVDLQSAAHIHVTERITAPVDGMRVDSLINNAKHNPRNTQDTNCAGNCLDADAGKE